MLLMEYIIASNYVKVAPTQEKVSVRIAPSLFTVQSLTVYGRGWPSFWWCCYVTIDRSTESHRAVLVSSSVNLTFLPHALFLLPTQSLSPCTSPLKVNVELTEVEVDAADIEEVG